MKIELITREEYIKRTKYWNEYHTDYCPLCGRTETYEVVRVLESERPKPKNYNERHLEEESVCIAHFL